MYSYNYINVDLSVKDQYIYRIVSIERLLEAFRTYQNVLVSPKKWDDPFENFILNSKVEFPNGKLGQFNFNNRVYGQCWTKHKASDAMWRIYSPKSKGVRIRTTIPKLASSLIKVVGGASQSNCFIGKVKYLNDKKLIDFANNIFLNLGDKGMRVFAETLLVKRPAFRHEREVRLIYIDFTNQGDEGLYSYYVNPHELIDQIMIDPRVDYDEYLKIKSKIREETGFKEKILRSLLYAPPKEMVLPFGKA